MDADNLVEFFANLNVRISALEEPPSSGGFTADTTVIKADSTAYSVDRI